MSTKEQFIKRACAEVDAKHNDEPVDLNYMNYRSKDPQYRWAEVGCAVRLMYGDQVVAYYYKTNNGDEVLLRRGHEGRAGLKFHGTEEALKRQVFASHFRKLIEEQDKQVLAARMFSRSVQAQAKPLL